MKNFLIIICFLIPGLASSQVLTAEEAVAFSLENNFDILLRRNDSVTLALNEKYANAVFLPRLNAQGGLLYSNNDAKQKFSSGAIRERNNIRANSINASVNLNWTIFDGMKMFASREKSMEISRLGELQMKSSISSTVAAVLTLYYNIVRQKQQLKAIDEQIGLSREIVKLAEKRFETGLAAKPALLQSKVDLNARKAAKSREITIIEQLKTELNQLMGVNPATDYDVIDSIPVKQDILLPESIASAEASNPELMIARQQISIAELTLKERKADRYPVIGFNSAYNFIRNNNKAVVNEFTPLFNRNQGFNYGFTASIPLFNNFTVKRQISEASQDLSYQKLIFDYQKVKNNTALINAFKEYQLARNLLELEEENILLAKENVFIATERLRLGISSYIEFREAQKSLEEAYYRLIATRYEFKQAETELLRLKGDLIR